MMIHVTVQSRTSFLPVSMVLRTLPSGTPYMSKPACIQPLIGISMVFHRSTRPRYHS
jgi:hypothetical protein